ncbi:short chain enoyl-CoA hydratase [Desulfocicer vacuolatum DSM 3385]|uniref:Enoyl-CoA hydratase domain-containing protein 3, mitochondrial n=1 Tax=Desulfocicer vacuolatum DSM 3385 TaxID=1121400 RepID=A0A1W2A1J5_9BACT|nr:enoyl-CoA hydratase-related protein [Desulfocicer vacuolatum]SMC54496.1 short chain enoyl-CoA hydratase [Desulfocicer vacuolatum DSM 3385]
MDYETIVVEIGEDFVGQITLNRPGQLNTFTTSLATELNHALLDLDAQKAVRVVLIKGEGKAFCAGIDVGDFFGKTASEYREWIECMETPLVTISKMKKPVIAQVHGVAAANGAGLVAAADLAIASDKTRLGLTAINVGLNCIGPIVPVTRSIGRKKALELLFYGDLITADTALDMGLINKTVPAEDLEKEARNWAAILARKSPVALQIAKKSFYAAADLEYHKSFEYMNEAFARLCTTEDAEEGIRAFLEKRNPEWKEK